LNCFNVCLIIEPHRYSRLNDLYSKYLSVLKNINNLIILKTYEAGENYKKGMKNSKNLVNDLNVLNNQKTKYIDNYSDLFSLLDQYVKNKRENIIISAGAGEISNQIRFFYESKATSIAAIRFSSNGLTPGLNLAITLLSFPIRNFSKFHSTSPSGSTLLSVVYGSVVFPLA